MQNGTSGIEEHGESRPAACSSSICPQTFLPRDRKLEPEVYQSQRAHQHMHMRLSKSNVRSTNGFPPESLFRASNLDTYFENESLRISKLCNAIQKVRVAAPEIVLKESRTLKDLVEKQKLSINRLHGRKNSFIDVEQAVHTVLKNIKNHRYVLNNYTDYKKQSGSVCDTIWYIDAPTILSKDVFKSFDLKSLLPNTIVHEETSLHMHEYERYTPIFSYPHYSSPCLSISPLDSLEKIPFCTTCALSEDIVQIKQRNEGARRRVLLMHSSETDCTAECDISTACARYFPRMHVRKGLNKTERNSLRKIQLSSSHPEKRHSGATYLNGSEYQNGLRRLYEKCVRATACSTNAMCLSPTWKKLENRKSFVITSLSQPKMKLQAWKKIKALKIFACGNVLCKTGYYNTIMAASCNRATRKPKQTGDKMHVEQLLPPVCRGQGKKQYSVQRVYDQEKQYGKRYDLGDIRKNLKHIKSDTFEKQVRAILQARVPTASATLGEKRKLLSQEDMLDKQRKCDTKIPEQATKMLQVKLKRKQRPKPQKLDTASIDAFVRGNLHTFNVAHKRTKRVEDEATKQKRVMFINPDHFKRWGVQVMRYLEKLLNCVVLERNTGTMRHSEAIVLSPDHAITVLHLIETAAKVVLQDIIYLLSQYQRVDIYINVSNFTKPYCDMQYHNALELQRMIFLLSSVCKVRLLYYDSIDILCKSISRYSIIQHKYSAYVNATDDDISDANEVTRTEYFLCQFPCFNVYSAFYVMSKYEGIKTFMSACMNGMRAEQRSLSTKFKAQRRTHKDVVNIPDSREKRLLWWHILSMQYP